MRLNVKSPRKLDGDRVDRKWLRVDTTKMRFKTGTASRQHFQYDVPVNHLVFYPGYFNDANIEWHDLAGSYQQLFAGDQIEIGDETFEVINPESGFGLRNVNWRSRENHRDSHREDRDWPN